MKRLHRAAALLLTALLIFAVLPACGGAAADYLDSEAFVKSRDTLIAEGIMMGYPDGSFGETRAITRAEMTTLICRILGEETRAKSSMGRTRFDDVYDGHWASGYINVANEEKITEGDGFRTFRPESEVTFDEVIKMLVCAKGYDAEETTESGWSAGYIAAADTLGITVNTDVQKGKSARRGDIAIMVANTIKVPDNPKAPVSGEYANKYTQKYIDDNKSFVWELSRNRQFTFLVVTDVHISDIDDGTFDRLRDIVMITREMNVDYVAVLGDLIAECYPKSDALSFMRKIRDILSECDCPVYYTRGNHDYNSRPSLWGEEGNYERIITAREWYDMFDAKNKNNPNIVGDKSNPYGGYYYVDMPKLKHRAIFLNNYEFGADASGNPLTNPDGSMGYWKSGTSSSQQIRWLLKAALNMRGKTDWAVTFYSHNVPYDEPEGAEVLPFHGYGTDNAQLRGIIKAFQKGTKWSGVYNDEVGEITADFTAQGAVGTVGFFAGHIHDDCFANVDGLNMYVSASTLDYARDSWQEDPTPAHAPPPRDGSENELSANMFIVNQAKKRVNVIKYGSKSPQGLTEYFGY